MWLDRGSCINVNVGTSGALERNERQQQIFPLVKGKRPVEALQAHSEKHVGGHGAGDK
jgi:hypothetical protein